MLLNLDPIWIRIYKTDLIPDKRVLHLLVLPVLCYPDHAAVVLVSPEVVLHPGVDDVAHGDIHVVRAEVLQEIHHLPSNMAEVMDNFSS